MSEPEKQKKNTAIDKEMVEKYIDKHDPHFQAYYRYGENHVLRKEFLSLIDQAHISEKVLEKMRDGISDMIARGVVNPCIPNGNNNELIDALNIRFNEANNIDELVEVFQEARSKNIEIKEEFDNAFFMIYYIEKIIQHEDENTSRKRLNDILNFMFYVYEFVGHQWDKDFQEDRNAPLTDDRRDAFMDYFKMFEDKWHPNGNKSEYSLENAVRTVYKNNKLKDSEKVQKLLLSYGGIDITKEENQEQAIKKLIYFFRKYTLDYCKEHNGCTINGFMPKSRKKHTEKAKKNISKGMRKKNSKNKDEQKQKS